MKIAHISDLHFCTPRIRNHLQKLTEAIQTRFHLDLEISYAQSEIAEALSAFLIEHDPDIIILSGDITTFGDAESFSDAHKWLAPILTRSKDKSARQCIIVPGNHDVLQGQFAYLVNSSLKSLPMYAQLGIQWWLRDIREILSPLLRDVFVSSTTEIFHNFNTFAGMSGLFADTQRFDIGEDQTLLIHPFRSVSTTPLWMNLGSVAYSELSKLNFGLGHANADRRGFLRFLVLHHNPISSPQSVETPLSNAYNSMPAGVQLLRTAQQSGVDLIFHGHQHVKSIVKFDFDLRTAGHAYSIGVPASTSASAAGCNLITVEDINHISVTQCDYRSESHRFVEAENLTLCLERNKPTHPMTASVRYEIKSYISGPQDGNEGLLWDEILEPGSRLIYISGRYLRFVTTSYLDPLRKLLEANGNAFQPTHIRMLLSNPKLLRQMSLNVKDGSFPTIWGREEDLDALADESQRSIDRLDHFISELGREQQRRIDIRVSHTLLPFAASVRDADKAWGKMVVRLLPVGAIGDLASPVVKLHRRRDRALYDYYFTHLKYLFANGESILGKWDRGDQDLHLAGLTPRGRTQNAK